MYTRYEELLMLMAMEAGEARERRNWVRPRYDLDEGEKTTVLERFLSREDLPRGRFIGVMIHPGEAAGLANVARTLESQVFSKEFGPEENNPAAFQEYCKLIEDDSTFLVVINREDETAVGMMRIVSGDAAWLMSIQDGPECIYKQREGVPPDNELSDEQLEEVEELRRSILESHGITADTELWDAVTIVARKEYRATQHDGLTTALLMRMFLRESQQQGAEVVCTMLDSGAFHNFGPKGTGMPFTLMAPHEPFPYYGSKRTSAYVLRLSELVGSVKNQCRDLIQSQGFVSEVARRGLRMVGDELDDSIVILGDGND